MGSLVPCIIQVDFYLDYTQKYSMDSGGVDSQLLCCRAESGKVRRGEVTPVAYYTSFSMVFARLDREGLLEPMFESKRPSPAKHACALRNCAGVAGHFSSFDGRECKKQALDLSLSLSLSLLALQVQSDA
jgi:hypothetical protein